MQCAIEMGPDHFVLTVDGFSGYRRPPSPGAIANTATTSGDVIDSAIGELNPGHA